MQAGSGDAAQPYLHSNGYYWSSSIQDSTAAHSKQAPFMILPLKVLEGDPFAALKAGFPNNFLSSHDDVFFLTEGVLVAGGDSCRAPDAAALVTRLHTLRPAGWHGVVFVNAEGGCYRKIRGGDSVDMDPEVAQAYDGIYSAWINAVHTAWPNSLVFGYFLPSFTNYYTTSNWPSDGTAGKKWSDLAASQPKSLAALDGFSPEFYWPRQAVGKVNSTIGQYRRALRYIVRNWPEKLVAPVVWSQFFRLSDLVHPYELSEAQGTHLLAMIYEEGAHGVFYWGPSSSTVGNLGVQSSSAHIFKSFRIFLTQINGKPSRAPGRASFLGSKGPFAEGGTVK
jgi:hypothetical protein